MVFGFLTYPKRLNVLFCDAVKVWLILGYEDALEVAVNAALTAAHKQRESMIRYAATFVGPLEQLCEYTDTDVGSIPTTDSREQTVELDTVKERLEILLGEFRETESTSLLQSRNEMNSENETAVQKGDTTYFKSRYPNFFLLW